MALKSIAKELNNAVESHNKCKKCEHYKLDVAVPFCMKRYFGDKCVKEEDVQSTDDSLTSRVEV